MFFLECPWCGERDESEFSYGGRANIVRPATPDTLTDKEWANYLFMRKNPRGDHVEQWNHSQGCRCWFIAERNTVTYKISKTYRMGSNQDKKDLVDPD